MDIVVRLKELTAPDLAGIVRAALRDDEAWPLTWTCRTPAWTAFGASTRGIYLLQGTARLGSAAETSWSVVLKVVGNLATQREDDPHHPFYWRRETLALSSGLFHQPDRPFVAVRLLGVEDHGDAGVWLWQECLDDSETKPRWTIEQLAAAAYDLGGFGAQWSAGLPSLQELPWLSQHWLRGWMELIALYGAQYAIDVATCWDHPLVASALPADTRSRFLDLMNGAEELLSVLESLPVTVAHHDAQWRNLFELTAPEPARPGARTVAVDWEFVGLAPVGADLGHLIGCNLEHWAVMPTDAARHQQTATAAYLQGLADFGWRGDHRAVHFASEVSAALQIVPTLAAQIAWLVGEPTVAELGGPMPWPQELAAKHHLSVEATMAGWASVFGYLLDRGDEARRLAQQLR